MICSVAPGGWNKLGFRFTRLDLLALVGISFAGIASIGEIAAHGTIDKGEGKMFSQLSRNGRFLALRGAVTLAFGVAALAWPQPSFQTLVRLFGLFALADGLVGGATAIGGRHASSRSQAILLEACTSLAVGLVLLVTNPTQLVFGYVIAGRFVLIGLLEVISSGYPPREAESEWVITLAGIASLLFGLTIVLAPGAAAGQRVTAIAAFMALLGLVLVAFASRVRDWRLAP